MNTSAAPILSEGTPVSPVLAHALASIAAAEVHSAPFPHIFFRNFFPQDFYDGLTAALPGEGCFKPLGDKEGARFVAKIYGGNLSRDDLDPSGRWQQVSEVLRSPLLEDAIRDRLFEGLEIRRKAEKLSSVRDLKLVPKPVVYRDMDGYRIKPHPDTRKKVITMQIYLPTDLSQEEMGTTLYRVSPAGLLHVGSYGLEPVKTFPFIPNVGYAFVVLKPSHSLFKTSWHGRPPIKTAIDKPRVTVLNTYYADGGDEG